MSRFEHIEINNPSPEPEDDICNEPEVIDQHYCMTKADAFFDDENYEHALTVYSRALQYDINMESAWLGQLRCLTELGELQEAEIWSRRALDRFPNSSQILAAKGAIEGRMSGYTTALKYIDAAFEAQGITPYVWIARGEVLTSVSAVNAKACFLKAIEMAKTDWRIFAWIGRSYMLHGCYHQALDYLKEAVRLDSNRHTCWYRIGKCYESLRQAEDARIAYRRALSVRSSFMPAHDALLGLENQGFTGKLCDSIRGLFGRRKNDKE